MSMKTWMILMTAVKMTLKIKLIFTIGLVKMLMGRLIVINVFMRIGLITIR